MTRSERRRRIREERKATHATALPTARIATVHELFGAATAEALKARLGVDGDGECRGLVLKVRI